MISHLDTLALGRQWDIQVEIFGRRLEMRDSQANHILRSFYLSEKISP